MLQDLLSQVVLDTHNSSKMYELAKEYDRLEQGAAAATFYLRAADYEKEDKLLKYKSLIRLGKIYNREGRRFITVNSILQDAISTIPNRPEAYYFLAKYFQEKDEWRPSLTYLSIAKHFLGQDDIDVDYPGDDDLEFLYARAVWKNNGTDDGKDLLFNLKYKTPDVNKNVIKQVDKLFDNIGFPSRIRYNAADSAAYKFPFRGLKGIKTNYARHFQDMFVLSVHDGKTNGSYVEIGSGDPIENNNTYLLEKDFGWKGLSVEINEKHCYTHSNHRVGNILMGDASKINYTDVLKSHCFSDQIDFLRINAEEASLPVLKNIPFNRHSFGVIQFQHNACWWGNEIRDESRNILKDLGYILVVSNMAMDYAQYYEDWWVHPNYFKKHMKSNDDVNFIWKYAMHEVKN
jgi:hypothetical protein